MGDAERCLCRQQTREVRKKPLINYRVLRTAASAEPRSLATAAAAALGWPSVPRSGTSSPETPRGTSPRTARRGGRGPSHRAALLTPGTRRRRAQRGGHRRCTIRITVPSEEAPKCK
ncbi:Hypothetical predicted protein [Marmota monax]|uniref:Uncharacterized protein n=1 Tax=Marmota monax TaxID=9995 RepID=A0A5E4CTM1_MARMO|nr:hypothetical protein GHT09_007374 [Marmota monax]VTJ85153.1 Hypothetical predicted protein [Marmota monax]